MSYLPDLNLGNYVTLTEDHIPIDAWKTWSHNIDQLPICYPTKGPWIAGGAVRRFLLEQDPWCADIDYFCTDLQQFHVLCSRLESMDAQSIDSTDHHNTYLFETNPHSPPLRIQIVRSRFKPTLQAHLDEFDFTICQTGWNGDHFVLSPQSVMDLKRQELNCTGTFHSPAGSWMRIIKYAKQGYTPSQKCITTLLSKAQTTQDTQSNY